MLRTSDFHARICGACAEICDRCAQECDRMGDDAQMKRCAEACRRCAESCRQMSMAIVFSTIFLKYPLTLQSTEGFKMESKISNEVWIMTLQLKVPNMACSACGDTITKAVIGVDPTAKVQADPKTKLVNIETQSSEAVIKEAITAAGYTVA